MISSIFAHLFLIKLRVKQTNNYYLHVYNLCLLMLIARAAADVAASAADSRC